MTTQALTFREMRAIRRALSLTLQHKESLPLTTESMETAFEKVEHAIDNTWYQQSKDLYFLIVPVRAEEITEESKTWNLAVLT